MAKIKVKNPVVEMDGDEMTRIIWQKIREQLILPYLDIDLKYFDLGVESRDQTNDQITIDSANATSQYGVAVKCATITPDEGARQGIRPQADVAVAERHHPQHPRRHDLPRADHLQERAAPRAALGQAGGRRPPRLRRSVPRAGLHVPRRRHASRSAGRPRAAASRSRARSSRPRAAASRWACSTSTRRSRASRAPASPTRSAATTRSTCRRRTRSSRSTTARFKNTFQRVFDTEFKTPFEAKGLTYEHRLIDDMVASNLKWNGGYLWACKNYDGDVQSDTVAQGYGSLGLMTSVLMSPDGKTVEAEAAHGTVTRHYRMHQQGKPTSTNPIASIYAWTRGLQYRGRFDDTPDVVAFAETLEKVCVDVVESGRMTKDLAILIRARSSVSDDRGVPRRHRHRAASADVDHEDSPFRQSASIVVALLLLSGAVTPAQQNERAATLDQPDRSHLQKRTNTRCHGSGRRAGWATVRRYTTVERATGTAGGSDIVRYDAATGARTILIPTSQLHRLAGSTTRLHASPTTSGRTTARSC